MNHKTYISLLLSFVILLQPLAGKAMETDQYNLSPIPLADIGDEVSKYVEDNLRLAVANVNADIAAHQACVEAIKGANCDPIEKERKKLAYLRSNDAVAKELYKLLGDGNIFITYFGKWIYDHRFLSEPASYKTGYFQSIYNFAPIDYATLSPTVRLFGTEFGTDKLEHIFQQGYKYYRIEQDAVSKGSSVEQASAKAVKWGQMTERTYFGLLVSGVYSNADLYANYAGMKFYQGLTKQIALDDKTRPALVVLDKGIWTIDNATLRENLLKPFLTDHLNEALNPSGYAFTIFSSVRRAVRKNGCPQWTQMHPNLTAVGIMDRSKALESWNGEDYGYIRSKRRVTIAEACFR